MKEARERVERVLAAARRLADEKDPLGIRARRELPSQVGLSPAGVDLALSRHLETSASPEELRALLESVVPARSVHVVLSANVFVATSRALALAWAAAPRVTLRPSRREPAFARLLLEALGRGMEESVTVGADGQVSGVSLGAGIGEVSLFDEVGPAVEQVHVYGRAETLVAVEGSLRPGVAFWGHGPGFGLVALDEPSAEDAARLASDIVPFDQRGCLSPRLVLLRGNPATASAFAAALAGELRGWRSRVPPGPLAADERADLARYAETMRVVGELHGEEGALVGFDPEPSALTLPPLPRAIHLALVASEEEARALLGPLAPLVTCLSGGGQLAGSLAALCPAARRAPLGRMQRPPLDGPVDRRTIPRG